MSVGLSGGAQNSHQVFSANLGSDYAGIEMRWNSKSGQWIVSVSINNAELINEKAYASGTNIFDGFFGWGMLIVIGEDATLDNLGITNKLIWISEDELLR